MALISRLFQASFSATLLWSAALAIALIVPASPARAEVVTLVCQQDSGNSFTLRVDYDRKIVDLLSSSGTAILSAAVTITESDVSWDTNPNNSKWDWSSDKAQAFKGGLNRLSGQGWAFYAERQTVHHHMHGPCRRATQKF